jgi:hypothetical protein
MEVKEDNVSRPSRTREIMGFLVVRGSLTAADKLYNLER